MESGLGRNLTWASYDKPTVIGNATSVSTLTYGVDRRRIQQRKATVGQATTVTTYVGALYEETEVLATGAVERHHYVMGNGTRVALIVTSDTAGRSTRYIHQDHLGSVAAVTDEQGAVLVRYFYDAYGRSVDEQGQPLGNGQRSDATTRGFTDHEHLDEVGLIHANARVLDPQVGQFLSLDPIGPVLPPGPDAAHYRQRDPQELERYSYGRNDPLVMVDPTGTAATWGLVGGMFQYGRAFASQTGDGCNYVCRERHGTLYRPGGYAGPSSKGYGGRLAGRAVKEARSHDRAMAEAGAVVTPWEALPCTQMVPMSRLTRSSPRLGTRRLESRRRLILILGKLFRCQRGISIPSSICTLR